MRILILNWRDIKDPKSGGAELLTHELAKRFVEKGHIVIHHNAAYKKSSRKESIDGVEYIRHGNYLTTYIYSFLHVFLNSKKYDFIIDEVHGIPYFIPLIRRNNVIVLALEVAKHHWSLIYPFPINLIGRLLEKLYFKLYKDLSFLTISPSSRRSIIEEGIPEKNITVIPMGLTTAIPNILPKKENNPTIVFLGRLAPIKGIEDAIIATCLIKKQIKNIKLWIIGSGDDVYTQKLRELVKEKKLENDVKFFGFVSIEEKFRLLAKAHILVAPSRNEGWGLIVPEAGVVGTPAVVYDVDGLRDIVVNDKTGIITKGNNPNELAKDVVKLLNDKKMYERIRRYNLKYSRKFSWDNSANTTLKIMKDLIVYKA